MSMPKAPDFLHRELASVLAETGDMRGAWELIQKSIDANDGEMSVKDEIPERGDGIMRPFTPRPRGTPLEEAYRDE